MEEVAYKIYQVALNTPYMRIRIDDITKTIRDQMMQGELVSKGYIMYGDSMRDIVKSAKRIINHEDGITINRATRKLAASMIVDFIFEEAQNNIKLKQGYIDEKSRNVL